MKHLGAIFAILAAFVGGAFVCAYSSTSDSTAPPTAVLPDPSVIPRCEFGSVSAAYSAIPHRRTELPAQLPEIGKHDTKYLRLMFRLIDQAIVTRVDATRLAAIGHPAADHLDAYNDLIACVDSIGAPTKLADYHASIRSALTTQRSVIQQWHRQAVMGSSHSESSNTSTPAMQKSSALLQKAYTILMQRFSTADQQTQDAFWDYHCALDFL